LLLIFLASALSGANAQSLMGDGFETKLSSEGGDLVNCEVPGVMPDGWLPVYKTWTQSFSSPDGAPANPYPMSAAWPAPVGAEIGTFRVVKITAKPQQSVILYFDDVQSNANEGYGHSRPSDGMWFALSPCAGDLRPPNPFGEPFLRPGCRTFSRAASVIWTTTDIGDNNQTACRLVVGQSYYLTIAPVNPLDGLQPLENTCLSGYSGCDVGAVTGTANF
jgi:hypothetical protein